MKHLRNTMHRILATAAFPVAVLAAPAHANEAAGWPDRMIKLVVPFPAGSVTDRIGRVLAQHLEASLKQSVVVENRPGAGATIGSDHVAKAKPDGYTILLGANASHAVNVAFMKLPYDPVASFEPISLVAAVPSVLMVNPSLPVKTVADLLALSRSRQDKITYTSAGVGTTGHLGMEMLASTTGTAFLHVPAKGPAQALQDVMGGHVDMLIESIALSAPVVKDGRLRGLAVTSQQRSPALPEMPTMVEAGVPGYELLLWFALYAPAGTPQAIVERLHKETARIFADPAVRDPLVRDGVTVVAGTPKELADFQRSEIDKFGALIRTLKLDLRQ
ncbi:Tripartite tricarboxylate transporter family receptor [Pigmentiphaga humi]|uniref:Tripartite tricarboxylate transporter family receptor n=1 Tax=Pigmentiphaga humi TaxID=2478468 RepID=A0A3P4AYV1_9BURK|nr:tripartite tricarboxylate transporter substrate binding protein [Pigmentiphaga humi]VCU68640.1 Tripartite tricarboxylate transporter family receptor [Pigmentiphaga humi]